MSYSNLFSWMPLGAVIILIYIAVHRHKKYKALKPWERLWDDYIKQVQDSPGWHTAGDLLDDFIIEELATADALDELQELYDFLTTYFHTSFSRNSHHERKSEKVVKYFEEKKAELLKQRDETHKKYEEEEARKEAGRFKAAQEASTWEEAQKVLTGNGLATPSAELAIQKINRFSLNEVLSAKTLDELKKARERARRGSLAMKFAPFMYEKIVKSMMEQADNSDELIAIVELSPHEAIQKDTALYMAFLKLRAELKN